MADAGSHDVSPHPGGARGGDGDRGPAGPPGRRRPDGAGRARYGDGRRRRRHGTDFGSKALTTTVTITGTVFNDQDADLDRDAGESGPGRWTIDLPRRRRRRAPVPGKSAPRPPLRRGQVPARSTPPRASTYSAHDQAGLCPDHPARRSRLPRGGRRRDRLRSRPRKPVDLARGALRRPGGVGERTVRGWRLGGGSASARAGPPRVKPPRNVGPVPPGHVET